MIFISSQLYSQTIYSFKVKDISGEEISLKKYEGKVVMIVNTASECAFTPQYKELEELYQMYKSKGFVILAFPSNDFAGEEPLNGKEIEHFCTQNYHTTFPLFDKINVKGNDANPLFIFLSNKSQNGKVNIAPKWNFHKYLIDKKGKVVNYYLSTTSPTSSKIKNEIETLLSEK